MIKLSERKNEDAIELLADIMEPVTEIFADKKFLELIRNKNTVRIDIAHYIMKNHATPCVKVIATLEGVPYEEYEGNAFEMLASLMQILDDKDLIDFFQSQGLSMVPQSSGFATENTEEEEK